MDIFRVKFLEESWKRIPGRTLEGITEEIPVEITGGISEGTIVGMTGKKTCVILEEIPEEILGEIPLKFGKKFLEEC